jgi:hypothetical protein
MTGGWRKVLNKKIQNVYSSLNIVVMKWEINKKSECALEQ